MYNSTQIKETLFWKQLFLNILFANTKHKCNSIQNGDLQKEQLKSPQATKQPHLLHLI